MVASKIEAASYVLRMNKKTDNDNINLTIHKDTKDNGELDMLSIIKTTGTHEYNLDQDPTRK